MYSFKIPAIPIDLFVTKQNYKNFAYCTINFIIKSIKLYYYKEGEIDYYLDIVQNISRNFTDMKLMRDRVVNKTYCEAFSEQV